MDGYRTIIIETLTELNAHHEAMTGTDAMEAAMKNNDARGQLSARIIQYRLPYIIISCMRVTTVRYQNISKTRSPEPITISV